MERNIDDTAELTVSVPEAVENPDGVTEIPAVSEAADGTVQDVTPGAETPAEEQKTAAGEDSAKDQDSAAGEQTSEDTSAETPAASEEAEPAETSVVSEEAAPAEAPAKKLFSLEDLPVVEDILDEPPEIENILDDLPDFKSILGILKPVSEAAPDEVKAEPASAETAPSEPAAAEAHSEVPVAEEAAAEETAPETAPEESAPAEKPAEMISAETMPSEEKPGEPVTEETSKEQTSEKASKEEKKASGSFSIPFLGRWNEEKDEDEDEDEEAEEEQETPDAEEADEEEQPEKTTGPLKMPAGSIYHILIAGVLILAFVLIYSVVQSRKVYSSYEVMSTVSNADDASASYQVNKNGMIRYSNNGIALTDKGGNVIWNQTYEMSNPIIASEGNYIAAGDRGASTLYIFNQFGQCGKLTTDLPLQGIQVAKNGVVAAILSDSESNFINLYDKQGNRLVGIRATLENTGYPLAVGISPDASRVVVSYLTISESARIQTKLVFYDFSSSTGEHEKHSGILSGLCPRIQFLGEQRVAVFREKGFDIYAIDSDIHMVYSTEFTDEIRSIFADEQRLGFIFRNRDENGKYRIELYDVSGQKSMTIYSNLDYTDLNADSDEVVLYNSTRAEIYKFNGRQVFGGDFENRITSIMPSWDTGMYWLVDNSRLSEIRVK